MVRRYVLSGLVGGTHSSACGGEGRSDVSERRQGQVGQYACKLPSKCNGSVTGNKSLCWTGCRQFIVAFMHSFSTEFLPSGRSG